MDKDLENSITDTMIDKDLEEAIIDNITKDTGIPKQVLQNDNSIPKSTFDKYNDDLIYNSTAEVIEGVVDNDKIR